ncbi:GMP/IMP nucleotidase [Catenovulum sediminis]|uniref:GMP/IMP nucleotidase n=1 Tax=Catenovulum sediminis TaxID=1740262 RepID=A0ABV1RLK8_9ALTE
MKLQWQDIDTVLLDMDGTLLDLHFDNYFWMQHLPNRYSELKGLNPIEVSEDLNRRYQDLQGQLKWYCFDYWAEQLELNIMQLKHEVVHLIQIRPGVIEFLQALKNAPFKVILLTNSHRDGMQLKFDKTGIDLYFDEIVSSHDYGFSKEQQLFWQQAEQQLGFNKTRSLFIDDSLAVLAAAKQFGIKHILAIDNPDSQQPKRVISDYRAISDYQALTESLAKFVD